MQDEASGDGCEASLWSAKAEETFVGVGEGIGVLVVVGEGRGDLRRGPARVQEASPDFREGT